jgi:hypothetical protein
MLKGNQRSAIRKQEGSAIFGLVPEDKRIADSSEQITGSEERRDLTQRLLRRRRERRNGRLPLKVVVKISDCHGPSTLC